ncbi:GNAT family N-acetyltransferase [Saccharopolyspora rhizosphaerae]|uniref:GNAT family N-acetyltransferase n=1 Tax=Saccharopolyspora rhizosphaerae TaxID=2492662 RepID=A0A3R8PXR2_9PSEU|nr:GNAT family N-acetyltransferase [Saccharopolyspora rhizosphaerae]RRO12626.1 GNAT family N-acetyltransferase [Saccharopolyspora rhizosphaerae]
MRIVIVGYDHPDSQRLIEELQQEYVVRYGEADVTPVDPAEFSAPRGLFLLGYLGDEPVASGGWRAHDSDEEGFRDGDAEIKRMYIVPGQRGAGWSRRMLAELESTAALAVRKRLVLETGTKQPEAIGLYTSSGYERIENFGVYRCDPDSRCYGKEL